jgi:multidrug efflux pump subunit AcrB
MQWRLAMTEKTELSPAEELPEPKGIIAWFTHNTVAANLLMILILIAGGFSALTIEKQTLPEFDINNIQLQVAYPGAAPQEVEQGILMPIEEALQGLNGIKKINATAREGFGSFVIEVDTAFELTDVLDEIKMRVDSIRTFPQQIEEPQIFQMRFDDPVMRIQVYGQVDEFTLKELAKAYRPQVAALDGVGRVELSASRAYEIAIEVTENQLLEYGLTFDQVAQAVKASSLDLPGGSIKSADGNILLRTKGQAYVGKDFEAIVLKTNRDGTRVLLSDVATVSDGFEEREGFSNFDGEDTVMLNIFTAEGENDIDVATEVRKFINNVNPTLPETVQLAVWADRSFYLQDRLNLMLSNMMYGGLLVFIVLSLFLRFKLALWVIVGMGVSFLGAMALMPMVEGLTINMLTLFGFILVLGIVVDDAIIIGESAYAQIEETGQSKKSVIIGATKVAMPATFGVLTTIMAFLPMVSLGGMIGSFWGSIGWVVILCLVFSLIESKWILPAHLGHMKPSVANPNTKNPLTICRRWVTQQLKSFLDTKYQPFLHKTLEYRYATLFSFVGCMILAVGVVVGGFARWEFFPKLPSDFIQAQIEMENGSSAAQTNAAVKAVGKGLERLNEQLIQSDEGAAVAHYFSGAFSETTGSVIVELTKGETRSINSFEIVDRWRDMVGNIPGAKTINFSQMMGGPPQGKPISFQLKGLELSDLQAASKSLRAKLSEFEGVYDIEDSFDGGNKEIIVSLKPNGAALGLTLSDVARQVRQAFYGAEAQRILRGTEEVKVMVRYPLTARQSPNDLNNMHLKTPSGDMVPFAQVANIEFSQGYATINRIDQVRSITVSADADVLINEPRKVTGEIRTDYFAEFKQNHPNVEISLSGMSQEEKDSLADLAIAGLAAIAGIYMLLAIPLKSYSQPLIIMSVIPFGFIGALMGHIILDLSFSILSVFGLIALGGVVVNDSLILVDFVNKARQQGLSLKDATVQAGMQRFRAIVLTSATTFFGLLPIVLEKSLQAQIVIPMAISLAFGILFSTLITLVLIPSLYFVLEDFKKLFRSDKKSNVKTLLPNSPS